MAIDPVAPRTRRAVLAASLGGAAAFVAQAVARPLQARAADNDDVLVGGEYTSSSVTKITGTTDVGIWGGSGTNAGLLGTSTSGPGVHGETTSGIGVRGLSSGGAAGVKGENTVNPGVHGQSVRTGVRGVSTNVNISDSASCAGLKGEASYGYGVWGDSELGAGVYGHSPVNIGVVGVCDGESAGVSGQSTLGSGVFASSNATDSAALFAHSAGNSTAVFGYSGDDQPAMPVKVGVYGHATQDAAARGVLGTSTSGQGVRGEATSGSGVMAVATSGYALRSSGRVRFEKSAGIATIPAGANSILVAPGINLTATSAVLATLQDSAGGTTTVHRVRVYTTTDEFRIYLTANATAAVKVAWFVLS